MVSFDVSSARAATLTFCKSPVPKTSTRIVAHLQKSIPGFYPSTVSTKVVNTATRQLFSPLSTDGFLIRLDVSTPGWDLARGMMRRFAKSLGEPVPRRVTCLYQTNFLFASNDARLPVLARLPVPSVETNLAMNAMLYRFNKLENAHWELLNLLLCASVDDGRSRLRISLYQLPLDYNEINNLEKVLNFGSEFKGIDFPFTPSIARAEKFLRKLIE